MVRKQPPRNRGSPGSHRLPGRPPKRGFQNPFRGGLFFYVKTALMVPMNDCLFCKFVAGELAPILMYEDNVTMVFMSLENHPLVVPKQHLEQVTDLDEEIAAAIMQTAVKVSKAVKEAYRCDGINLVQSNGKAAGQDVFHFHLHIKPRFENDSTTLSWDTDTVEKAKRIETARLVANKLS